MVSRPTTIISWLTMVKKLCVNIKKDTINHERPWLIWCVNTYNSSRNIIMIMIAIMIIMIGWY